MGKVIQEHYGAQCTTHELPCPVLYNSAESYKCKFKNVWVCVCFKKNNVYEPTFFSFGVHIVSKGEVTTHVFGCVIMIKVKIVYSFVNIILHVFVWFIVLVL